MNLTISTLIIISCFTVIPCVADMGTNNETPWEFEDINPCFSPVKTDNHSYQVGQLLSSKAIWFYRNHIASQSISRCPFYISCSRYAEIAIAKNGFVKGTSLFIDRHFFREHLGAFQYYELRTREDTNMLKLDDTYYLGIENGTVLNGIQ